MGNIQYAECEGVFLLRIEGEVRLILGPTINRFLDNLIQCGDFQSVVIDLRATEHLDSTALGVLAKIAIRCRESFSFTPTIVTTNPDITRLVKSMGIAQLFVIDDNPDELNCDLIDCPQEMVPEAELREQILEAHRILMEMNESNRLEFQDVVEALERESAQAVKPALVS